MGQITFILNLSVATSKRNSGKIHLPSEKILLNCSEALVSGDCRQSFFRIEYFVSKYWARSEIEQSRAQLFPINGHSHQELGKVGLERINFF